MFVFNKNRNNLLFGIFIFIPFSFLLVACSSNTILTENLELTLPEQKMMQSRIERNSDNLYISNLKSFAPPKEKQLIEEAQIRNLKLYNDSARILSDWVLRTLSQRERNQMARNCEALVGNFKKEFPLNEQTLACAAWWLEKKNNDELVANQRNQYTTGESQKFLQVNKKRTGKISKECHFLMFLINLIPVVLLKLVK